MLLKNAMLDKRLVDIEIDGEKIAFIGKKENYQGETVDLGGKRVFPALIDIHSHGVMGIDTMDCEGLSKMSLYQAQNGICAWLPTTMTMDQATIKAATNVDIDNIDGARVLGFHLEGPYISAKYKGAQNEKYIKNPNLDEFSSYKNIKLVTLAPELCGSMEFIEKCGCRVSLGHTDCDFDIACEAFDKGASCVTHLFNAMSALHHRKPSLIGAAIEKDAFVQVICDGFHIHKSVIQAAYRIFSSDRMILISDSMRATGLIDGEYDLGGQAVTVANGTARLSDGTLAGSAANLFQCVKKAQEFGISTEEAIKMATETPAKFMGIFDEYGKIKENYYANIIAVDDNFDLKLSICGGKIYKNTL